jgi:hypothetical protein
MCAAKQVRCGDVGWSLARDVGHEALSGVLLCARDAGVCEARLMNKQTSGFGVNRLLQILTVLITRPPVKFINQWISEHYTDVRPTAQFKALTDRIQPLRN